MTRNEFCQLGAFVRLDSLLFGPKFSGRMDQARDALVALAESFPVSEPVLDRWDCDTVVRPWLPLAYWLTILVAWAQISVTWLP